LIDAVVQMFDFVESNQTLVRNLLLHKLDQFEQFLVGEIELGLQEDLLRWLDGFYGHVTGYGVSLCLDYDS
jgi:hypothetical protein